MLEIGEMREVNKGGEKNLKRSAGKKSGKKRAENQKITMVTGAARKKATSSETGKEERQNKG
ncbi:hypothetical protein [Bartonella apis]|uniref:hypothetical protein n=1 Tax=Bartonella apis TaxID=1686310 RepID=UPI00096A7FF3|nr:hypothetical protein [Bartonella apis]